MTVEQSLLDLLSIQMKCEYLSDLRFLSQEQRRYLAQKLNRLTPRGATGDHRTGRKRAAGGTPGPF